MDVLPPELVDHICLFLDLDDILRLFQAYKWLAPQYSRSTYPHMGLSTFEMRLPERPRRIQLKLLASDATSGKWRVDKPQLEAAWRSCQMVSHSPRLMWCDTHACRMEAWLLEGLGGAKYIKGQVRSYGAELEIELTVIF